MYDNKLCSIHERPNGMITLSFRKISGSTKNKKHDKIDVYYNGELKHFSAETKKNILEGEYYK